MYSFFVRIKNYCLFLIFISPHIELGSVVKFALLFFEMCLSFFDLIKQVSMSFKHNNLIYQIEKTQINFIIEIPLLKRHLFDYIHFSNLRRNLIKLAFALS